MLEPKYDEDVVNLGYLKKAISDSEEDVKEDIDKSYSNVSRHYSTRPNTPYYKGDTWIDGNVIYNCINTRLIGSFVDSDWVSESGAKAEAESKNKVFLTIPVDYNAGDMWILQSDEEHNAGKKGEILISTVGRNGYDENDWVNMLSYGSISSINEVANNLNSAIDRIGVVEEAIGDGIITTYYQNTVPATDCVGDLWYVTDNVDDFIKGKLYRFDGNGWVILDDPDIQEAFDKANEARLVADGKIQSFYSDTEPMENMGVGDLWIDLDDSNKLYRYNGTSWVAVYDTRVDTVIENLDTVTERTAEISTDLGQITQVVSETETRLNNDYLTAEQVDAENQTIKDDLEIIKQQQTTVITTAQGLQVQIDTINNEGVKSVKNTTVDINESGISVGKSDSEFSTAMNNTGTYMYAYGKQIAKYDKDGMETGNLKATGEVELGHLKIVKTTVNNEKRTHIHWVGG